MENEFKGTKGPWFWDDEGLGNNHHIVFGKGYSIEMTSKENKALISAAPELLDALLFILNDCSRMIPKCAEDKAISAINKALGK